MELINHYLDEVKKVHGVYVLLVDEHTTNEEATRIDEAWRARGESNHLIIMPKTFELSFLENYSMYVALMMVRGGADITRISWLEKMEEAFDVQTRDRYAASRNRGLHSPAAGRVRKICKNMKGEVVIYNPVTNKQEPFVIDIEAMDADDYILLRR